MTPGYTNNSYNWWKTIFSLGKFRYNSEDEYQMSKFYCKNNRIVGDIKIYFICG